MTSNARAVNPVSVRSALPAVQPGDPPSTPPGFAVACEGGSPYTLAEIRALYARFAADLVRVRERAERFCAAPKPPGWPHYHRCQYSAAEMELLYLFVRAERPHRVLELCSAVGYTTLWVLSALADNGYGELWSFDNFDTRIAMVELSESILERWHFERAEVGDGTIVPLLNELTFDRIIMDADHSDKFSRWYTASVLSRHLQQVAERRPGASLAISIHDIFDTEEATHPLSSEGRVALEWLSKNVSVSQASQKTCMLMSPVHNEVLRSTIAAVRRNTFGAEAAEHVWGKQNPECSLFLTVMPHSWR
jgi:predicted O-methyltransferase YrrM